MFSKKPEPTFEERLSAANAEAAAAASVFEDIALDFDNAAHDKFALAEDIYAEIGRLESLTESYYELMAEAQNAGDASQAKAANVRALMGK